jgi:hypothetical protein
MPAGAIWRGGGEQGAVTGGFAQAAREAEDADGTIGRD